MPHPPFHRESGGVDARAEVDGNLNIAQLGCGGDAVNGDVGRAERRPEVVGIGPELAGGVLCCGEEGTGGAGVVGAGGGHGAGQEQSSVDGEQGRRGMRQVGLR
ncbi:hypothetical protein V2I01_16260 [Micromonospora sp. BRA006-A]|nr:hypothetical protein [Micromonospora sp. BRA006-A]